MSKGVCHLERYHRGDTARIRRHNEQRESHSNPDIDKSRSHLNEYAKVVSETWNEFADSRVREFDEARERLGIRKMRHDKNAVLAVGCILSASNDFFEGLPLEDQRKFLRECVAAMTDFVGEENVMSVAYHFDETTPHAHLMFAPIIYEEKFSPLLKKMVPVEALSASRQLTKASLTAIQNMMFERVFCRWGLEDREHGSQARHLSVKDFKQYKDEIRKIQQEIARLRSDAETSESELAAKQAELNEAKKILRAAKKEAKQAEAKRDSLSEAVEGLEAEKSYLELVKQSLVRERDDLRSKKDSIDAEIQTAKSDLKGITDTKERLSGEIDDLTKRRANLSKEVEDEKAKLLAGLPAEVAAEKQRQVDDAKKQIADVRDEWKGKILAAVAAAEDLKKIAEAERADAEAFVKGVGYELGISSKAMTAPIVLQRLRNTAVMQEFVRQEQERRTNSEKRKKEFEKQKQIIDAAAIRSAETQTKEREKQNRIFEATAAASMQEPPSPTA